MTVLEKFRLDGKAVLVTGASRGLGRAMAIALAEAGANVALVSRDKKSLAETAAAIEKLGRKAPVIPCDVSKVPEIERACADAQKALGDIEILVNNAGIGIVKPMEKVTPEEWNEVINVNLSSYFFFCQKLLPGWKKLGRGKVINIASIDGIIAEKQLTAYCASKGGVIQLTKSLALEWSPLKINVNALAPGYFLTDINRKQFEDPKLGPAMLARIPLRRWGEPEELGPLAVYMASPASDFMTGETVVIDGGQVIK
ncbi:MAG: glucose 1-dehydrogenase [Bdellovibrionota bacterium]